MSLPHARVIVNPASGAGAVRRKWPRIQRMLSETGLPFDHEFTQGALHGTELAKEAVAKGYELVVALGGDGTINEVVNGLIGPAGRSQADLGIIYTGTANDFARSLGLPRNLRQSCSLLTSPKRVEVDVGAVEYVCRGELKQRLFVNVAGAGFDAAFLQAAVTSLRPLGAKLPYVAGLFKVIMTFPPKDFLVSLSDGTEKWRALTVLVSNGRYAATMPFACDADLVDGQFEVMPLGFLEMLQAVPKAYLRFPDSYGKAKYKRSSFVQLESQQCLQVEADGEVLGELPARMWVLPKALRVVAG
ncbi:MAG: diacylglycerol kinase family lipid kinase [Chloroflexi bacterium]|nr:diacylglycerol kinase family lipid kinase [Chloroflexota bacterium]